ncbi:hypothetical protein SUGI_0305140 [Cryptomeria japonica]|nr:hypothetical protein SUGI_0305140 [Cryptomeria japonica]
MDESRVIGVWADVGWEGQPHVPQLVFSAELVEGRLMKFQTSLQGPWQKFIPNHLKGLSGKRSTELGGKPSYAKVVKFSSVNEAIRASRLNTGAKMMDKQSNSNPLELSSSHQRRDKVRESSTSGKDDKVSENQTGSDLGGGSSQIFAKNDGVVSESNVGVSSLGFPDDAILAQQVKELVSNSSQHVDVDVDVDNNATLGNNIQLGDIPVIVPDENLVHQTLSLSPGVGKGKHSVSLGDAMKESGTPKGKRSKRSIISPPVTRSGAVKRNLQSSFGEGKSSPSKGKRGALVSPREQ